MLRGIITFKCTKCGNKFKAPDFEYMATIFSVPQPCPKCGSMRTRPASFLLGKLKDKAYEPIWKNMEEK